MSNYCTNLFYFPFNVVGSKLLQIELKFVAAISISCLPAYLPVCCLPIKFKVYGLSHMHKANINQWVIPYAYWQNALMVYKT